MNNMYAFFNQVYIILGSSVEYVYNSFQLFRRKYEDYDSETDNSMTLLARLRELSPFGERFNLFSYLESIVAYFCELVFEQEEYTEPALTKAVECEEHIVAAAFTVEALVSELQEGVGEIETPLQNMGTHQDKIHHLNFDSNKSNEQAEEAPFGSQSLDGEVRAFEQSVTSEPRKVFYNQAIDDVCERVEALRQTSKEVRLYIQTSRMQEEIAWQKNRKELIEIGAVISAMLEIMRDYPVTGSMMTKKLFLLDNRFVSPFQTDYVETDDDKKLIESCLAVSAARIR